MPGFPGLAIGAGLGQFEQQYQQQQAQREREQMLRLTLAKFQQEQQDRQAQEQGGAAFLRNLPGGGGFNPVGGPPAAGGFPGGGSSAPSPQGMTEGVPNSQLTDSSLIARMKALPPGALRQAQATSPPMPGPGPAAAPPPAKGAGGYPTNQSVAPSSSGGPVDPEAAAMGGGGAQPQAGGVHPELVQEAQGALRKALPGFTPDMSGKLGYEQTIARINQDPTTSTRAKLIAIELASKHFAPEERHKWEQFKMQNQQEFALLKQEISSANALAMKDVQLKAMEGRDATKGYTMRENDDGTAVWVKPGSPSIPVDAPAGSHKAATPLKQGYQTFTDKDHKDAQGNPDPIEYQMIPGKSDTAVTMAGEKYTPSEHASRIGTQPGRLPTGQALSMQKFMQEHPKATSDDIQHFIANQSGLSTAQRVLMQRGTTLEMATNISEETIPLLKATSHRLSRTQFPTLNSVLLAAEQGTGGEDVVKFTEQLNSFQYLYARALNPTGVPRIEDMRRLEGIVAKNWTEGQIDAALDQIVVGLAAEKRGIERTKAGASGAVPPVGGGGAAAPKYSVGQIVPHGGKQYRVISINPAKPDDPEIEEVK